jgi:acetyl/propionyl-CoA carboxylase alpha subunit
MIGKLLVHRRTREEAIRTMLRALDEFVIEGPKSTIHILRDILDHSDFRTGACTAGVHRQRSDGRTWHSHHPVAGSRHDRRDRSP